VTWKNVLLKDVVSHTALMSGTKPKGKFKINERVINKIVSNFLSEAKRNITPYHTIKNYAIDYIESKKAEIKEVMEKDNLSFEKALSKVYSAKDFVKFTTKNETIGRAKRLTRDD